MKAVNVSHLDVVIDSGYILQDISFCIEEGDIAMIIGPNGAGKTTLVKALLGLVPVKRGKIKIFGMDVLEARNLCGYVPQRFYFDRTFPMTVEELLKFSLIDKKAIYRIDRALEVVDMLGHKKEPIGNLSGGQLQRVLIARALVNEPKILFMDEPVGGIDIAGRNAFYRMLSYMNKSMGLTIVLVSHEIDVVYKFSTRVICISRVLHCHGHPHEKLTPMLLKELYGGDVTLFEHKD